MLGWIGNIFFIIGIWQAGDKHRHAFLHSAFGNAFYVVHAIFTRDWALLFISVVLLIMSLRAWVKWGV